MTFSTVYSTFRIQKAHVYVQYTLSPGIVPVRLTLRLLLASGSDNTFPSLLF